MRYILLLLLLLPIAQSETYQLVDMQTGQALSNTNVQIHIGDIVLPHSTDSVGTFTFNDTSFEITSGHYYGRYAQGEKRIIPLARVGTLKGTVLDENLHPVAGASLAFICSSPLITPAPVTTDASGSFKYEYAPAGNCKVSSSFNDSTSSGNIMIQAGEVNYIALQYQKPISLWPFLLVPIMASGLIYFILRNQPTPKAPYMTSRRKDILDSLTQKESAVVHHLMDHGHATTDKLTASLNITKKVVNNLKKKHIIQTHKDNTISLSDWFKGK